MNKRSGFTLLEVLVVVVIAISVTAFAVPAYKKTQEHNKYLAAKGVLLDVGSAVRALRADLANIGVEVNDIPRNQIYSQFQDKNQTEYGIAADNDLSYFLEPRPDGTQLIYNTTGWFGFLLFAKEYLAPIAFDASSDSVYKGYHIYICPAGGNGDVGCCKANASENKIACIKRSTSWADCKKSYYPGAYLKEDGSIEEFGQGTSLAGQGC